MDDPNIILGGELMKWSIGEPRGHQGATEENDSIAIAISKIRVGEAVRFLSAHRWIGWENETLVETTIAQKFEDSHRREQ